MSAAHKPKLCDLALVIQEVLAKRHDAPYVASKMRELDGMSAPEVFAWSVTNLDPMNQRSFLTAIGVDPNSAGALRRVFDKVRWARPAPKEAQPCSSQ